MKGNSSGEMATALEELARHPDLPANKILLISKLQAILAGSREAELWLDEGLDYDDAVELKLIVEELKEGS